MLCVQAHEETARQQRDTLLRAQRAEEERANYQAAMRDLQQRNQILQQQEAQRQADVERHRQQRLQQEQAHSVAHTRHASQKFSVVHYSACVLHAALHAPVCISFAMSG